MNVQIQCEEYDHENIQLSSIFLKTWKSSKNYLIFKAYVCLIQTKVYIHIQTQRVHKDICMKARGSKDVYV